MIDTRVNISWKDTVDSFITWREAETSGIKPYPGFICRYSQHLLFFDTATDYRYCTSQEAYDATEANRAHLQTVLDLQEAMKVRAAAVGLEMRKAHALQALYAHIDSIVPPVTAQEVNAPGADRSKLLGGPLYARVQMFGHSDDLSKAIVGELLLCTTETCLACTSSVDMLQSHADGILSRLRAQGVVLRGPTGGSQDLSGYITPGSAASATATTPDEVPLPPSAIAIAAFSPGDDIGWQELKTSSSAFVGESIATAFSEFNPSLFAPEMIEATAANLRAYDEDIIKKVADATIAATPGRAIKAKDIRTEQGISGCEVVRTSDAADYTLKSPETYLKMAHVLLVNSLGR